MNSKTEVFSKRKSEGFSHKKPKEKKRSTTEFGVLNSLWEFYSKTLGLFIDMRVKKRRQEKTKTDRKCFELHSQFSTGDHCWNSQPNERKGITQSFECQTEKKKEFWLFRTAVYPTDSKGMLVCFKHRKLRSGISKNALTQFKFYFVSVQRLR